MGLQVSKNKSDLGFKTAEKMREIIESDAIPSPPKWKSATIRLPEIPDEPQTLIYRDINEVVDFLFGNPTFAGEMDYIPKQVFEEDGKTRVYHEFSTGSAWWDAQVSTI